MSFLDKILAVKQEEINELHSKSTSGDFRSDILFSGTTLSLMDSIKQSEGIAIIAEIKKASPSKGLLRPDFDHLAIAQTYFENEVNGVSILTDLRFFQGDIRFLREIAEFKTKPLLRKDFILDEYQIFEAKANGADAILLISEALTKESILSLTRTAHSIGLEVLLELHSEDQIEKIDLSVNKLIGVNNRNLSTFVTDIQTTIDLRKQLPNDVLLVSESGIGDDESLDRIKDAGCDAILVGEYLMKGDNIAERLVRLKNRCRSEK